MPSLSSGRSVRGQRSSPAPAPANPPARIPSQRTFIGRAAFIALAALGLRLAYLFELRDSPLFAVPVGDGWVYVEWARRIASGQLLPAEPFYQSPLYPYAMAAVFSMFGEDLMILRVLQAVASTVSCVLLALAGRGFFHPRAGLIAAGLLAVYPWSIFSDGLIQKSSLDLLLMTSLLAALGWFVRTERVSPLAIGGLSLGLFTLNREAARVLVPVVLVWLVWYQAHSVALRTRARWGALFFFGFVLVTAPVAIQNYRLSGQVILSTWQFGPNFYIGNHAGANGTYVPLAPFSGSAEHERDDAVALARADAGPHLAFNQVSDYWFERSRRFIAEKPMDWLRLLGWKALLSVNAAQLPDTEGIAEYARHSVLLRSLVWITPGVVLPFAALGIWVTASGWRRLAVLYGMAAGFFASLVLFYVFERYRFPVVPIVILFAAAFFDHLAQRIRTWHATPGETRTRLVPAPVLVASLALAVLMHLPLTADQADTTLFNVGLGLMKAGRPGEAVPVLRQAVERYPDHGRAHYALGQALDSVGDRAAAVVPFDHAARLSPDDWQAHSALAQTLRALGRLDAAVPHFSHAARLAPLQADLHANLGTALAEAGRAPEALESFRAAVRLDPENAGVRLSLATLLVQMRQSSEAVQQAREATRLMPGSLEAQYVLGQALALNGSPAEAIGHFEHARRLAVAAGRTDLLPPIDAAMQMCRDAIEKM